MASLACTTRGLGTRNALTAMAITVLLCAGVAVSGHEEPYKTRWEKATGEQSRARLARAGVRTLTLWTHVVEGGKVTDRKSRTLRQEYDAHGRLVAISAFANDAISESAVYSYNPAGDMVTDVDLSGNGAVTESNVFAYDDAGRVTAGIAHSGNGLSSGRFEHRFDRTNHRIVFVKFDAHDAVDYTIEYTFAGDFDAGDYVAAVKQMSGKTPVLQVKKTLDSSGRTLEKKVLQLDKKNAYAFRYRYRDDGVLSEVVRVGSDGRVETTTRYGIGADGLHAESRVTDALGVLTAYSSYEYERVAVVK